MQKCKNKNEKLLFKIETLL